MIFCARKLFIFCLPVLLFFGFFPVVSRAQGGIEVSPVIINETALARDIFNYEISITNNTDRKAELYAVVNEVNADGSRASSTADLDRAISLRKWINITHGVIELLPGESTVEDLEIKVSPYALPGQRYAAISIVNAPDRYAAEKKAGTSAFGQIFLSYKIEENIVEKAQITKFAAGRNIYIKPEIAFSVVLSNFGNQEIFPAGKIYIFDRRGRTAAELAVGGIDKPLLPGQESAETVKWDTPPGIGRYKAKLEINYGQSGLELMDTVYLWYLPWQALAVFSTALFLLLLVLLIILFKKSFGRHHVPDLRPTADEPGVINLREGKK